VRAGRRELFSTAGEVGAAAPSRWHGGRRLPDRGGGQWVGACARRAPYHGMLPRGKEADAGHGRQCPESFGALAKEVT
ncbi:MAG: hypothetical protein OXI10_09690, partial [Gammaproteobacteria bacterium]|nr:hypothetical protein [Gammaproteobacteria bacterium]